MISSFKSWFQKRRQPRHLGAVAAIALLLAIGSAFLPWTGAAHAEARPVQSRAGVAPGTQATSSAASRQKRITQAQVNQYLVTNARSLSPLDSARARLLPAKVEADLLAYGFKGTIRTGLAAKDGRIVVVNPKISGALAWFVSAGDVGPLLEQEINRIVNPQRQRVTNVQVINQAVVVQMAG